MSDKFQHLSEVLVRQLQERDQLIHSLNVKNTFVSALLKVQSLRYHPTEEKLSTAKVSNYHQVLSGAQPNYYCTLNLQYLQSVIPFHPPASGNWGTPMLQQLTKSKEILYINYSVRR